MTPQRIAVKLFPPSPPGERFDLEPFTTLFHRFIQESSVPGLLVDVADYAHVPDGPGIVLIGHEVDYAIDSVGGRTGLLVVRKRCGTLPLAESVRDALSKAASCAQAIELDAGTGLRFDASEIELQIFDRLEAPNDDATFEALRGELKAALPFLEGDAAIERSSDDDPRKAATVVLRAAGGLDLAGLRAHVGG